MRRPGIPENKWARAWVVGGAAALLAIVLSLTGVLDGIERGSYDIRARMLASEPDESENEEVVLILVDEDSLDWALEAQQQSWPWPRQYYAVITDFARRANVASLTFDVMYNDSSFFGVSDDQMFADSIDRQGRTSLAAFYGRRTGSAEEFPDFVDRESASVDLEVPDESRLHSFVRASFPVQELSQAAARLGNVNLTPDPDGVYRRAPVVSTFDNEAVPSLALAAYLASKEQQDADSDGSDSGEKGYEVSLSEDGRRFRLDGTDLPLDSQGNLIVRFDAPRRTRTRYAASGIIQSEIRLSGNSEQDPVIDPSELEGKHVMVGFSAVGLFDLRPMPVDGEAPGVEFHASMLENLLSGRFIRETPVGLELLYVGLLVLLVGFLATLVRGGVTTAAAFVLAPAVPAGLGVLAYAMGLWLPLAVPAVAGVAGAGFGAVVNYAKEGKERRFIKGAFSQYLSPAVIERLLEDPRKLELGGERRELTIFFSDLQGFTSLSEGLSPDELTQLLNEYLSEMTDIIIDSGGTIDKYEGDAIIAFWNAPLDVEDHPTVAVDAALQCQAKLEEMRPAFRERVGKDLLMRVGLNTGQAVVGNLGSRSRFDYTMLGDAVNLAARLEGNNKQFGTYTMIAEATASRLPDRIHCRELGRIAVVGRAEPVRVYEPMTAEQYAAAKTRFDTFSQALGLYYEGSFEQARTKFLEISDDPPAGKYAERCAELAQNPPAEWSGVWIMESK